MKMHIRVDSRIGLTQRSGDCGERARQKHRLPALLQTATQRVYGDSAYTPVRRVDPVKAVLARDFTNQRVRGAVR